MTTHLNQSFSLPKMRVTNPSPRPFASSFPLFLQDRESAQRSQSISTFWDTQCDKPSISEMCLRRLGDRCVCRIALLRLCLPPKAVLLNVSLSNPVPSSAPHRHFSDPARGDCEQLISLCHLIAKTSDLYLLVSDVLHASYWCVWRDKFENHHADTLYTSVGARRVSLAAKDVTAVVWLAAIAPSVITLKSGTMRW